MPSHHNHIHLDADAFFASVEQAAMPSLRGKAMAVGGERRGIIASASYEARRSGVYTPMPTAQARKLCPQLIVIPGDFEKYEQFSRRMFSYIYDFTPMVEVTSIDEGYFDLSGTRHRPREVAETLRKVIWQRLHITVSEGIGPNKLISQIASKLRKPDALIEVPPDSVLDFLWPLANRWLPGVGPVTGQRLDAANLSSIEQIARAPVEHLVPFLGKRAKKLSEFANGIDERPLVVTHPAAKSYGQQRTFGENQVDFERVYAALCRMADNLMAKVRRDGKLVRTLTVKLRYKDMDEDSASESLKEPTDLEDEVYGHIRGLIRKAWRRRMSLRLVSLRLTHVYASGRQTELAFDPYAASYSGRRDLAKVVDRIRAERGRYAVMRGHDLLINRLEMIG